MMLRLTWQMVKNNLLGFVRDRRALFFAIVMPLVLTSILGFALSGVFGGKGIPKFTVGVVNEDKGDYSASLIKVLSTMPTQMSVVSEESLSHGRDDVSADRVSVLVAIPNDFSASVASGRPSKVDVESTLNNNTKQQVVQAVITSFGKQAASHSYITSQLGQKASDIAPMNVDVKSVGLHPITSGAYYAIGMMVMFMLTNAIGRAELMVVERNSDLYRRLLASPASRQALLFGHLFTVTVVLFLQGALLTTASRYVLGVTLGPWGQTFALLFCYSLALAGISVLLGTLIKNQQLVQGLGGIGGNVLAVLGGSIFPLYGLPPFVKWLSEALPNGVALSSLVNSISGMSFGDLTTPLLYLAAIGVALGLVSSLRYGRTL